MKPYFSPQVSSLLQGLLCLDVKNNKIYHKINKFIIKTDKIVRCSAGFFTRRRKRNKKSPVFQECGLAKAKEKENRPSFQARAQREY